MHKVLNRTDRQGSVLPRCLPEGTHRRLRSKLVTWGLRVSTVRVWWMTRSREKGVPSVSSLVKLR